MRRGKAWRTNVAGMSLHKSKQSVELISLALELAGRELALRHDGPGEGRGGQGKEGEDGGLHFSCLVWVFGKDQV